MPQSQSISHKSLFLFSVPSILASLLEPLASLVDTALVGRMHTEWLGALAVGTIILSSFTWIFNFLIHATTHDISSADTPTTRSLLKERIGICLTVGLGIGLVSSLVLWFLRYPLYQLAGAENELIPLVDEYFSVRILGQPLIILYTTSLSILRGLGRVQVGFLLTALSTGINIATSWFLLYVAQTGLSGAAWGTLIAHLIGCLLSLAVIISMPRIQGFWQNFTWNKKNWFHFGKNSGNIFLRTSCLSFIFFFANHLAAKQGVATLAAHQILLQIYLLSSYFTDGIAVSANIIGSNTLASGDISRLKTAYRRLLHWGLFVGLFFSLIYWFGQNTILELFSRDTEVLAISLSIWPLLVLTQPLSSLSFTYDGLMFGLGAFSWLKNHLIIATAFIFLPLTLYCPSLECIWGGIIAVNLYRCLALFTYTRQYFLKYTCTSEY